MKDYMIVLTKFDDGQMIVLNCRYIVALRRVHFAKDDATEVTIYDAVADVVNVRESPHEVLAIIARASNGVVVNVGGEAAAQLPFDAERA